MASSFALIGVALGVVGPALGLDGDHVRMFGAWVLIAMAAALLIPVWNAAFTRLLAPIADRAGTVAGRFDCGSLSSAFTLGAVLGLVWSPCSGPLLASALALVASEGGAIRGGVILGLFGLGAALPLVGVAYASRAGVTRARNWLMGRIEMIKHGFAALLGLMGVAILLGWDKALEAQVVALLPAAWLDLTVLF